MSTSGLEMDDEILKQVLALVYSLTGVTMDQSKKNLLQSRLGKRLRELNISSCEDYLRLVRLDPVEKERFIDSVTTHETYFVRTKRVWDFFNEEFLPQWFARLPNKKINIWSAAASTGQEAYSIAMFCQEFKLKNPSAGFQILGTDISPGSIKEAATAIYNERSIASLKSDYFDIYNKYIKQDSDRFSVSAEVKAQVQFKVHNLFSKLNSPNQFEIVFLRNVLIYFEPADQEKVIRLIFERVAEGGILIVGESDSLTQFQTNFQYLKPLIYQKGKAA